MAPNPLPTALDILNRFYAAEKIYMSTPSDSRDFSGMGAVLSPSAQLIQSPDLPYGGTYVGHSGYLAWAEAMASYFDRVEPHDVTIYEESGGEGSSVVVSMKVNMRIRRTGREVEGLGVQIVKVDRERVLIVEMRPIY